MTDTQGHPFLFCYICKRHISLKEHKMDKKDISIKFISNLEQMPQEEIMETLTREAVGEGISCINWEEYPYAPEVSVRLAYSEKALILLYKVSEEHVLGNVLENNGPVWEDSCVETFIEDPVNEGYYNIEVNCIGTKLAAHRLSRTEFEHFSEEKQAEIKCWSSLERKKTDLKNQEWTLLEIVPFSTIGLEKAPEYLNVNFYKCGDNCSRAHYLSWSPIGLPKPDFHCPKFFGKLRF